MNNILKFYNGLNRYFKIGSFFALISFFVSYFMLLSAYGLNQSALFALIPALLIGVLASLSWPLILAIILGASIYYSYDKYHSLQYYAPPLEQFNKDNPNPLDKILGPPEQYRTQSSKHLNPTKQFEHNRLRNYLYKQTSNNIKNFHKFYLLSTPDLITIQKSNGSLKKISTLGLQIISSKPTPIDGKDRLLTLPEIRQKYPEYNDLQDIDLIEKLHKKFYPFLSLKKFENCLISGQPYYK